MSSVIIGENKPGEADKEIIDAFPSLGLGGGYLWSLCCCFASENNRKKICRHNFARFNQV